MTSRRRSMLVVLVTIVGCGGSVAAGPGDDGGTTPTGDSSVPVDDATTTSDGEIPADAIFPPFEAGSDSSIGASDAISSGETSSTGPIACGKATCDGKTQVCCESFGGGGGGSASCIAIGDKCTGAALSCSGSASCPSGDVCCATRDASGIHSTCETSCDPKTSVQLCESDKDCAAGERCRPAGGGFNFCRAGGGGFDGGVRDTAPRDTAPRDTAGEGG